MACKVIKTSSGGCTHFITTPDPEGGVMTVGFGQGVVSVIKQSRLMLIIIITSAVWRYISWSFMVLKTAYRSL